MVKIARDPAGRSGRFQGGQYKGVKTKAPLYSTQV